MLSVKSVCWVRILRLLDMKTRVTVATEWKLLSNWPPRSQTLSSLPVEMAAQYTYSSLTWPLGLLLSEGKQIPFWDWQNVLGSASCSVRLIAAEAQPHFVLGCSQHAVEWIFRLKQLFTEAPFLTVPVSRRSMWKELVPETSAYCWFQGQPMEPR